jgi:hypothetical protein
MGKAVISCRLVKGDLPPVKLRLEREDDRAPANCGDNVGAASSIVEFSGKGNLPESGTTGDEQLAKRAHQLRFRFEFIVRQQAHFPPAWFFFGQLVPCATFPT